MTTKSREGQPNPDAAIIREALDRFDMPDEVDRTIWVAVHFGGQSASEIADWTEEAWPAFAQALREGIAARRGQRFGGHGGG